MGQLKLGTILQLAANLQKSGMTIKEISELPVYLGRDDELNGIHTGWFAQLIDPNNENDADFVELIKEDRCNIEIKGKSILIS